MDLLVSFKKGTLSLLREYTNRTPTLEKLMTLLFSGGSLFASTSALLLYCFKDEIHKLSQLPWAQTIEENLDALDVASKHLTPAKRTKRGHPPGIVNTGNTCFANCVLQAVASLESSNKWIIDTAAELDSNSYTVLPSLRCLVQALSNKKYFWCETCTTSDLIGSLQAHGWVIPSGQQDAHEFYQVLMSTVDEEITKAAAHNDAFLIESPKRYTVSPFKGLLASCLTCLTCGYECPVKFEHFDSISLRIPRFTLGIVTLESCLQDYVRSERVDDVSCPGCRGRRSSFSKQMFIAKAPKCLCLQIQRTYVQNTGRSYKNPAYVKFPELLDVSPFSFNNSLREKAKRKSYRSPALDTQSSCKDHLGRPSAELAGGNKKRHLPRYQLMASVVHHGDLTDGHFITYRRNVKKPQTEWVYISDTLVKKACLQDVLSSVVYLLFYERTQLT